MISPENFVFNEVATELRATYPNIFVAGEFNDAPAKFPAVTIVEADNSVLQKMSTLNIENAVSVMYEVNVFSNIISGKKQETKKILATIDEVFASLGFTRTMCNPVANLQDNKIYRMVARYTGVCDKNYTIYTK